MTPELFLCRFTILAEVPNALDKFRELVLALAVSGRLLPQDGNDEPAHETLAKYPSGVAKRFLSSSTLAPDEAPFAVPRGWVWVRLPGVLQKLTDGTHHSPPNAPTGDFLYVTAKNIKDHGVDLTEISYVSKQVHDSIYSRCDPAEGDILFIKDGATTGVVTINQLGIPFSMLSSVALLKPTGAILNRYLLFAMRSPFYYRQTRGAMKGAAITRVNLSELAESVIPLPPLAEQKRIVAKVDELMALCDRLEAQQQQREHGHAAITQAALARFADAPTADNLEHLFHESCSTPPDGLREAVLSLAVRGRLCPQDLRNPPPRVGPEVDGRHDVPASWRWVSFASVGDQRLGKMLDQVKNSGVLRPYLRNTNVQWMRFVLDDVKEMRLEDAEANEFRLQDGDLLICEGGEPGRCAIWRDTGEDMFFQKAIHRVRPGPDVLAEYLAINLRIDARNGVLERYFTGATIKHLTGRSLREYTVPIPPLAEQRRIVTKVNELMALVDRLEADLAAARATGEKLMDAIVAELTAPELAAEPAPCP